MTVPVLSCARGRVTIYVGDVLDRLQALPNDFADCVITSPPYWGLRDYGVEGQIGLEATLGEHIETMVSVFAEIFRVLKPHGTLWLNYGDCYASAPNGRSAAETKAAGTDDRTFRDKPFSTVGGTIKAGDLCMLPETLAIALRDWGWALRSRIVWGKPNPMPDSSGTTRPSTAHEMIFMLSKPGRANCWRARDTGEISFSPDMSEKCRQVTNDKLAHRWIGMSSFYDAAAVRVERKTLDYPKQPDGWGAADGAHGTVHRAGRQPGKKTVEKQRGHRRPHTGATDRWDRMTREERSANGRLLRNYEPAPVQVWHMSVSGFSGAHFATFPPELVERCLVAGCVPGGVVLDPFGGAGTAGLVAARHGRSAHLIELNPEYAALAAARIDAEWGERVVPRAAPMDEGLFAEGLS